MKSIDRNFSQFKIDPLSEIRNAGIVTNGRVVWVKKTTDSDYTTLGDEVGYDRIRATVNGATTEDVIRADRNDYVLVTPSDTNTPYDLTAAIDVNKNRVHIVGVGYTRSQYGKPTFRGYATSATVDTELMSVRGAGVEVAGIKLLGTTGTHANGTINNGFLNLGTSSAGTPHGFYARDLSIENTQSAAAGGTTDLVQIEGDVATGIQGIRFDGCWIGNWSWAPAACVRMGGTAGPTRVEFRDTTFVIDAQATTDSFVTIGTGVTEYALFENCKFFNVAAGTLPASALVGAVLADNPVIMSYCTYINVTQAGTDTEVFKAPAQSGTSSVLRDYGIASGTAALGPA